MNPKKGKSAMMIRVLCRDKSRGYVEESNLQDLIRRGVVVAFFRPGTNKWINVQNGNIRMGEGIENKGPERRK